MAMTMKDIARAAAVDVGTVSHVLNNRPKAEKLRSETRERIRRIAQELGYCRNELASSVARGHVKVLAFVTSDMGTVEYMGRIQNGVFNAAAAQDYAVTVYHLTPENEEGVLRKLIGWKTAGVVFHISQPQFLEKQKLLQDISAQQIPFGTANLIVPGTLGVSTDDSSGARAATKLLAQGGCRRIAFLQFATERDDSDDEPDQYIKDRLTGYLDGIRAFSPDQEPMKYKLQYIGDKSQLLQKTAPYMTWLQDNRVDGVVCTSDTQAADLVQAARERGIAIPQQLAVTGFGGLAISSDLYPQITTVVQDFEEIGRIITEKVIKCVRDEKQLQDNIRLPVRLIERQTTRKTFA